MLWPLEGLPRHFGWISDLMPIKFAVIAIKAIVSKGMLLNQLAFSFICSFLFCLGMGIGDRQVYEGIFITLAWLTFYLFLAVLIFRR